MLEFQTDKQGRFSADAKRLTFRMDQPDSGLFAFSMGKSLQMEAIPAQLGEYSEVLALPEKRRPHVLSGGNELALDASGRIPFGAEPLISRKIRFDESSISVVTDFELRNSFEMKTISGGGLKFSGRFTRIALLFPPEKGCALAEPEWKEFAALPETIYEGAVPPLAVKLETMEKNLLRFEIGEDYWRWINASRLNGTSSFKLLKTGAQDLEFTWGLFTLPEDQEPLPGRNWRFSWNLFIGEPETVKANDCKSILDLDTLEFKPAAALLDAEGNAESRICLASSEALNSMKRWLRTQLADAEEGDVFGLLHAEPHFCTAAAHMERPKLKQLSHWDSDAIFEFLRWANRQLAEKGARLVPVEK